MAGTPSIAHIEQKTGSSSGASLSFEWKLCATQRRQSPLRNRRASRSAETEELGKQLPGAIRRWLSAAILDSSHGRRLGRLKLARELHGTFDMVVSENLKSFMSLSAFFRSSIRRCLMACSQAVCANSAPSLR